MTPQETKSSSIAGVMLLLPMERVGGAFGRPQGAISSREAIATRRRMVHRVYQRQKKVGMQKLEGRGKQNKAT